jgi:hypothetical protein
LLLSPTPPSTTEKIPLGVERFHKIRERREKILFDLPFSGHCLFSFIGLSACIQMGNGLSFSLLWSLFVQPYWFIG